MKYNYRRRHGALKIRLFLCSLVCCNIIMANVCKHIPYMIMYMSPVCHLLNGSGYLNYVDYLSFLRLHPITTKEKYKQYSQRGTFINPLTPVVRIIHARSNTVAEHPLTLVVMTLAYRGDRTRGFAMVAREGSSRSTGFHRLHCTCNLYKISD